MKKYFILAVSTLVSSLFLSQESTAEPFICRGNYAVGVMHYLKGQTIGDEIVAPNGKGHGRYHRLDMQRTENGFSGKAMNYYTALKPLGTHLPDLLLSPTELNSGGPMLSEDKNIVSQFFAVKVDRPAPVQGWDHVGLFILCTNDPKEVNASVPSPE